MIKRLFVLIGIVLLSLSVASAQTFDPLLPLRYFPMDVPFAALVRTDARTLEQADALWARLRPLFGDTAPASVFDALTPAFNGEIRPWLGASAALGAVELARDGVAPRNLYVAQVSDEAAAIAAVETAFTRGGAAFDRTESGGVTRFDWQLTTDPEEDFDQFTVAVGNGVLLAGVPEDIPSAPLAQSLLESPTWTALLTAAPVPAYVGYIYADTQAIAQNTIIGIASTGVDSRFLQPFDDLTGAAFFGFTLANDNTPIMDVVVLPGSGEARAQIGFEVTPTSALDTTISRLIPEGTALVAMGTDLGANVEDVFRAMRGIESYAEQYGGLNMALNSSDTNLDIGQALQLVGFGGRALTGLDVENEILPALRGDYALYMDVVDVGGGDLDLHLALLSETNDPAFARALVEGIEESASVLQAEAQGANFTGEVRLLTLMPETGAGSLIPTTGIALRASPSLLMIGTAPAVTLSADLDFNLNNRASMFNDRSFTDLTRLALPEAQQFLYADTPPIVGLLLSRLPMGFGEAGRNAVQRAAISVRTSDDGTVTARFMVVLGDAPAPIDAPDGPPTGGEPPPGFSPPDGTAASAPPGVIGTPPPPPNAAPPTVAVPTINAPGVPPMATVNAPPGGGQPPINPPPPPTVGS